jgi:hypothetical protein
MKTSRPILPTPLVSTDWLAKHLGDPDLRVPPTKPVARVRIATGQLPRNEPPQLTAEQHGVVGAQPDSFWAQAAVHAYDPAVSPSA